MRANCPALWAFVKGGLCTAPLHYRGPCSPVVDFSGYTVDDKLQMEGSASSALEWRFSKNPTCSNKSALRLRQQLKELLLQPPVQPVHTAQLSPPSPISSGLKTLLLLLTCILLLLELLLLVL
ncbi:hypothetical protein Emed_004332 [Eimeria media]